MPSIKPLEKLVKKARDLREGHSQRHRPTGFGFALSDSVDYLDAGRWDALTAGQSIFLSRRYLRVLEDAGPENLQQRYALIFRGREAVAAVAAQSVKKFSYRPLETDPNMVLEISPKWRAYDDYLASLTSKYRKTAKQIEKDVAAAGWLVEDLNDVAPKAEALHGLYLQTHHNAKFRPVMLPVTFLPALAAQLGSDVRWTVIRRDDQLLGFVNVVRDGETAVGYYIGFDREQNGTAPIYFRLLQSVVDHAIKLGCRRLSLGRTALEPKARLGARPEPMQVWIRHRIPMLNVFVRGLLHTISHDEAPERNPFK